MFGNLHGWIAAFIIAALTGGLIYLKGKPEGISRATGGLSAAMTSAGIKPEPRTVIPPGTKDQDAGDIYRKLAQQVKDRDRDYTKFMKASPKRPLIKSLDSEMNLLIESGECARATLFAGKPEEVVGYMNSKPLLPELQRLGVTAVTISGILLSPPDGKGKPAPADVERGRKLLEAVFHMGRVMYEERFAFEEYRVGVDLMGNAAGTLAKFGNVGDEKKAQLTTFVQASDIGGRYTTTWQTISGIPMEGQMVSMPGDIFKLATESAEPMWRAEATLKLGRMYWMTGVRYGDQQGAKRVIDMLAGKTDLPPAVKAAATLAKDIVNSPDGKEKFNRIGGAS